jgi:hypothetical protein
MSKITCDGFTFDSDTADVFCHYGGGGLRIQRVILLAYSGLLGVAVLFKALHYWSILGGVSLVAYVYLPTAKDIQKGFFTAVVGDRMCIRTGHGEATVLIKDIEELVFHINTSQLVMKDGRRIGMNPSTENNKPIYRWMVANLKTPYKTLP